jgi:DNA-binding response OmpR family regulator
MAAKAHLLFVEDDDLLAQVTKEELESVSFRVDIAGDGLAAWEKLNRAPKKYELILLDKQMPRMDGISLLRRLKADDRFKDLPVIMLTSSNQPKDIADGLAAGAYYYLIKPATLDILQLVITNALTEYRQTLELRAQIGRQTNSMKLLNQAGFRYRTLDEARDLSLFLAEASLNPSRTVTGFLELLINAVEHGNLNISYKDKSRLLQKGAWADEVERRLKDAAYAHRFVTVSVQKTHAECRVTILDQGKGFRWQNYVDFSPERAFDLHGRGIALAKATSFDSLEYSGSGNEVTVTVKLH